MAKKYSALTILVLVLIALVASAILTYASSLSWTDPGGSGLTITFTTPDTYYSCISPGDRIYTTGIPANWSLNGYANVVVVQPDGSWQSVNYYTIDQSGDLDLTLSYPPAWTWPVIPPPDDTREIHVDLAITVRDENGQVVPWVGGDPNLPGVLGPGQDWDVFCKEEGSPDLSIIKYTNGADANDPDGADVPDLAIGATVTWTYHVTNTGNWPIHKSYINVSDDQPGVTPVYNQDISGNGDDILDPCEVWEYIATGTVIDLSAPPQGVNVVQGVCTREGTEPPRTAYVNIGTVTIPGVTTSDPSSYCNTLYKVYIPYVTPAPPKIITKYNVFVGFEDLPIDQNNDYDYNDWLIYYDTQLNGTVISTDTIDLEKITFNMTPQARGAALDHEFYTRFPAGTFGSDGVATLTIWDENHVPISVQLRAIDSSITNDILIFDCTCNPLPPSGSLVNTIEIFPSTSPVMTATLEIEFDNPAPFVLTDYHTHGDGLFFEPFIRVMPQGAPSYDVGIGDITTIVIPFATWKWPEERVFIQTAYPLVLDYTAHDWPIDWWAIPHPTCTYGDGITCTLSGYLELLRSDGLIP